jgi:hypothetical protein
LETEQDQKVRDPQREEEWAEVAAEWEGIVPDQARRGNAFAQNAVPKRHIKPESPVTSRVARSAGQKWSENKSFFTV